MPHVHNGLHHNTQLLTAAARAMGEVSGAQDFSGIERFGETLTPIVNLWDLPEWALLRGEVLYTRRIDVAAVAAQFGVVELVMATGRNNIATVLGLHNLSAIDLDMNMDNGAALTAAFGNGVANDGRFPPGEMSQLAIHAGTRVAGVALSQWVTSTLTRCDIPWVLTPGDRLFIAGSVVNTAIRLNVFFTERQLLPTEGRA